MAQKDHVIQMLRLQLEQFLSRKQEQDQKLEEFAALFSSSAQKLKEILDVDAASMLMRLPPGLEGAWAWLPSGGAAGSSEDMLGTTSDDDTLEHLAQQMLKRYE